MNQDYSKFWVRLLAAVGLALTVIFLSAEPIEAQMSANANKYKKAVISESRRLWGFDAPIPMFAAQIHQESAWRPEAESRYAKGLTQFTPGTAGDINLWYESELSSLATYSPLWAIRAMVLYDKRIFDRLEPWSADILDDCDKFSFTLSSYNGGPTWLYRDRMLAKASNLNPDRWFENVELVSNRADWAIEENRDYVRRIMFRHQKIYMTWGGTWVSC